MRTQQNAAQRNGIGRIPAVQASADAPVSAAAVPSVGASGRGSRSAEGISLTRRGRLVLLGLPATAVFVVAVVGLILLLGGLTNQVQASAQAQPGVSAEEVTIAPGDTLWSVAASADSEAEIQEIIDRIAELNGLSSSELEPGQTLYVPAD